MFRIAMCLSTLLMLSACMTTSAPSSAIALGDSAKAKDGSQLICTYDTKIGSRFKEQHCLTADERERIRTESKEAVEGVQATALMQPNRR